MGLFSSIASVAAPLIGGIIGGNKQESIASDNAALQKEFAQNGIQWKVADARAAGINPLFALGAPTTSFSPTMVGDTLGDAISNSGQNLARAIDSTRDEPSKTQARMQALTLEKAGLENDLLRSQIARLNPPHVGPAMPTATTNHVIPGQGDPTPPALGPFGVINDTVLARNPDGSYSRVPSPEWAAANQNIISGFIPEVKHMFRNQILPLLGRSQPKIKGYRSIGPDYYPDNGYSEPYRGNSSGFPGHPYK